jgi:hypothetical protein
LEIIGPIQSDHEFGPDEFEVLQKYESTERIEPAVNAALDMELLSKAITFTAKKMHLLMAEMQLYLLRN